MIRIEWPGVLNPRLDHDYKKHWFIIKHKKGMPYHQNQIIKTIFYTLCEGHILKIHFTESMNAWVNLGYNTNSSQYFNMSLRFSMFSILL